MSLIGWPQEISAQELASNTSALGKFKPLSFTGYTTPKAISELPPFSLSRRHPARVCLNSDFSGLSLRPSHGHVSNQYSYVVHTLRLDSEGARTGGRLSDSTRVYRIALACLAFIIIQTTLKDRVII